MCHFPPTVLRVIIYVHPMIIFSLQWDGSLNHSLRLQPIVSLPVKKGFPSLWYRDLPQQTPAIGDWSHLRTWSRLPWRRWATGWCGCSRDWWQIHWCRSAPPRPAGSRSRPGWRVWRLRLNIVGDYYMKRWFFILLLFFFKGRRQLTSWSVRNGDLALNAADGNDVAAAPCNHGRQESCD